MGCPEQGSIADYISIGIVQEIKAKIPVSIIKLFQQVQMIQIPTQVCKGPVKLFTGGSL